MRRERHPSGDVRAGEQVVPRARHGTLELHGTRPVARVQAEDDVAAADHLDVGSGAHPGGARDAGRLQAGPDDGVDAVLREREWIAAGRFTVADIMMADVLRQTRRADVPAYPNIHAYRERASARPAFVKAHADQLAHFIAGDEARRN